MTSTLAGKVSAVVGVLGVALAVPGVVLAHGGSHPTPWPTPSTPSPSPSGGAPRPSKPPSGGAGGTGTGAPSKSGWEEWWEANKWQFTTVARRDTQLSGEGKHATPEEETAAKSVLTGFLTECLKHEYYDIRSAAALALGKAGDKTATEALVGLIPDSNRDAREGAVLGLGLMKDPKVIPLLVKEVFENPKMAKDYRMHAAAAIALGFIGDKAATAEIMNELKRANKDKEIQYACIAGLGLLKDESAVPYLYEILITTGNDKYLRAYAASALGKCGIKEFTLTGSGGKTQTRSVLDELVARMLTDKEEVVKQSAVLALGALGGEAQFERVYAATEDKDKMTQNFAIVTLPRLAKGNDKYRAAALTKLTGFLNGRDHGARGFAACALGVLGDAGATQALRKSFTSESDPSLRAACAIGLGLLKDKTAQSLMSGVLMGSNDTKLMGYCCIAIGLIGDTSGVSALQNVVKTSMTPELKAAAAIALANIGNREAIPVLVEALKERSNYARQSTIVALGYFRDIATIKPMQDVYADAQSGNDVRTICVVSLGYIVDRFERPVFKQLGLDFNYTLPGELLELVMKLF